MPLTLEQRRGKEKTEAGKGIGRHLQPMTVDGYLLLEVDVVQVLGLALQQVQDERRVLKARQEGVDLLLQHLRAAPSRVHETGLPAARKLHRLKT